MDCGRELLADGRTPCERRFGEPCKGPIIPFGAMTEYHPISAKDQLHQFGEKVSPGIILGCALFAVDVGKEILWFETLRSWETETRQKIHARRLNEKEMITLKNDEHVTFPIEDGTIKLCGRDCGIRKSTLMRDQPVRSEDLRDDLPRTPEKSHTIDERKDDAEARNDFWPIEGDFIYRHHVEPEFSSTCRGKKHAQHH